MLGDSLIGKQLLTSVAVLYVSNGIHMSYLTSQQKVNPLTTASRSFQLSNIGALQGGPSSYA